MGKIIALITDFGFEDIYVGVMKGVMKRIYPEAELIDITHAVPPQSVRGGGIALRNSYSYFPEGTVFLVVVDPGVGSKRRAVLVEAGGYRFIAPDNGVLSYTLEELDDIRAVELTNSIYQLDNVSTTFHGRDIFAPAAAHAARGNVELSAFGKKITDLFNLPEPHLQVEGRRITGEVTHIDHFGNIITSVGPLNWVDEGRLLFNHGDNTLRIEAEQAKTTLHGETIPGIIPSYHEAARGDLLVQVDSNGYLEIAINQGDAASRLDAMVGDVVELTL